MNKQKFVEYLRAPESLDEQQFDEFKQLLVDHPYFSIAKTIAARAAKNLNDENKGDLITTAAIYATDRKRLKKYISGDIIFLTDKPKVSESEPEAPITQKAEPEKAEVETQVSASTDTKNLTPPTTSDVDQILDELEHDMEELRKSRMHFAEIQSQLDEIETPQKTVKEEIKEKPDANDVSGKEKVSESDGKDKEERDKSLSGLMIDLEALKKEFEQEESKGEPKSSAKSKNVKPDSEEAEPLASSNEKESTPPKSKNIVTNMSEGEENDDNEPGYFDDVPEPEKPIPTPRKKKPARADRDSRMKVKRSELDQMMGLKSIPKLPTKEEAQSKEETPKKATKKKTSTAKKPTAKKAAEDPEEKPKPKPATKKKSATKKNNRQVF